MLKLLTTYKRGGMLKIALQIELGFDENENEDRERVRV